MNQHSNLKKKHVQKCIYVLPKGSVYTFNSKDIYTIRLKVDSKTNPHRSRKCGLKRCWFGMIRKAVLEANAKI